jgi:hypothetical protein
MSQAIIHSHVTEVMIARNNEQLEPIIDKTFQEILCMSLLLVFGRGSVNDITGDHHVWLILQTTKLFLQRINELLDFRITMSMMTHYVQSLALDMQIAEVNELNGVRHVLAKGISVK